MVAKIAYIGVWDLNIAANRLEWDDAMYEIYGVSKSSFGGAYGAFIAGVHTDDRIESTKSVRKRFAGLLPHYDTTFRIIRPSGDVRHIKAYGVTQFDAAGKPVRQTGVQTGILLN